MKKCLCLSLTVIFLFGLAGCNFFTGKKTGEATGTSIKKSSVNVAGSYRARGTNPDGRGNYQGTVAIASEGDQYKVHWEVGNVYDGIGKVDGNVFKVEWGKGDQKVGLVTYTIEANGVLQGTWYTYDNPKSLGTETLTPH